MTGMDVDIALRALETLEMRSLAWGFVDQSLSEAEAEAAIAQEFDVHGIGCSPEDALDEVVRLALVRTVHKDGERRYRSRFAEIVRLALRLKQWFPNKPWESAPTLVSDYRVDVRPRRFPKRNVAGDGAWASISRAGNPTPLQAELWSALISGGSLELAQFQVDSTARILWSQRGSGTVVSAGTGSGKTLAFYLPAILAVGPELKDRSHWTKVVCIYPRQELLKDQLSEAYALTLRVRGCLEKNGKPPIVLASLFSATPWDGTESSLEEKGWPRRHGGFICPYLRCPICEEETVWPLEALAAGREQLDCVGGACPFSADNKTIRLTRKAIAQAPPDFIFTTTEMLNQRLSDTEMRRLFGVGNDVKRQPFLTLLDEAHTYSGITGAQTALVLRRWQALLGSRMRWVGLSATLPQPERFFSELTGVRPDWIASISPRSEEMTSEGGEYQLILRADPASQAGTLSTSIQAVMLLTRMLDPIDRQVSGGRFGSKAFVFTDDLDVTHRLFDDILDAEAYTAWRRPDPRRVPLAALRTGSGPDAENRDRDGQRWQMAEDLSGSLSDRLRISRTTARDPGVNKDSQVIVATSTLEVGFNDRTVGAVVQHKAPRSAASFLQRRGRAGRSRGMRPISVTVLSDYGRDRVAFQSYEQLFDPMVEVQHLPLRNGYVLRIQAVLATFDWIASKAPNGIRGWAWRSFAGPPDPRSSNFSSYTKEMLRRLIRVERPLVDELRAHLAAALSIDSETLDGVLWYPPRALFLEALPTLARRVFKDWKLASGVGLDLASMAPPHPLPDFVPASLFADLMLPEVSLVVPGNQGAPEYMPLLMALQQFPPGRVRRRFADAGGRASHWIDLSTTSNVQQIPYDTYASKSEYLGHCDVEIGGVRESIAVYRPWELTLSTVPVNVGTSSNSQWNWVSQLEFLGTPRSLDIPDASGVSAALDRVDFWLHRLASACSVKRFVLGGNASLRVNQQEQDVSYAIVDEQGRPAALGFSFEADALSVSVRSGLADGLDNLELPPAILRWLRYLAFKDDIGRDLRLPRTLNPFRREWLHQGVLLAAIFYAERTGVPLVQAARELMQRNMVGDFSAALDALVNGICPPDEDETDDVDRQYAPRGATRLHATLVAAIADSTVREILLTTLIKWLNPAADDWARWLTTVLQATIGEAVFQACLAGAPVSAATEGLVVDVLTDKKSVRVVVSETTLGGGGTIEALADTFCAEPRRLVRCLESACAATDQEIAAEALRRIVDLACTEGDVGDALMQVRAAQNTQDRDSGRRALFAVLAARGIAVSRTTAILIGSRLARPGTSLATDRLMRDLVQKWDAVEDVIGMALPMRVAAVVTGSDSVLKNDLAAAGGAGREITTAISLMWPARGELRQRALQSYNPFKAPLFVEPALARILLFDAEWTTIAANDSGWSDAVAQALGLRGAVRVLVRNRQDSWKKELIGLLARPIVSGFLQFYPMVESSRVLEDGSVAIHLVLRERV